MLRCGTTPLMFGTIGEFDGRRFAPATERNREPILAVLERVLPERGTILELASGTGEHAAYFAPRLAPRVWQPSEPERELRVSIRAHAEGIDDAHLLDPLELDATDEAWPVEDIAALVAINMLHISPWAATEGLMKGAWRHLPAGGPLYLYGPYFLQGETALSNLRFDRKLRAENPGWGLREVEKVTEAAMANGLKLEEVVKMPANNLSLVFRKT